MRRGSYVSTLETLSLILISVMKNLQAMDNSHVALVAVNLEASGFKKYRCDRPMPLGVNLNSLTKVLKCAKDDDICTIKASDDVDVLNLVYEAKSTLFSLFSPLHLSRLVHRFGQNR
jgi:proliferating cell nuclear antigen PCNA